MIDEPGVYEMPDEAYFADPVMGGSLTSTGARKLLPPSCPALFRHYVDQGQPPRRAFDVGHAAHTEVLGVGAPVVVIDADDYRAKAARTARDEAHAAGHTPVLAHEWAQVQAMAAELRAHPLARKLLQPGDGVAEQTLVWVDDDTGVWCRARLDWQTHLAGGRLAVVDYKTCVSAEPGSISRSVDNYGYYQQDDFYRSGAITLGLDDDPAFLFVFQEKTAPYLVTVAWLRDEDREWGRLRNRKALHVYRDCKASGRWPGYADDVVPVSLPAYATARHEAAWAAGAYETDPDTAGVPA